MNDPDLQKLADLWQEPDSAEQAEFEAMARKARRQGRLLAYVDIAFVGTLLVACFFGLVVRPSKMATAIALTLVLSSILVTWKRQQLRQMARTLDTSDRNAFLESSIRNAAANLRRVTLSLTLFPVGIVMAILFKIALRGGGHLEHPLTALWMWAGSTRGLISLPFLSLIGLFAMRSRLRLKAELRRLEALKSEYAEEAMRDEADSGRKL